MKNNELTVGRFILELILGRFKFYRKMCGGVWLRDPDKKNVWVELAKDLFTENELTSIKLYSPRFIEDYRTKKEINAH